MSEIRKLRFRTIAMLLVEGMKAQVSFEHSDSELLDAVWNGLLSIADDGHNHPSFDRCNPHCPGKVAEVLLGQLGLMTVKKRRRGGADE